MNASTKGPEPTRAPGSKLKASTEGPSFPSAKKNHDYIQVESMPIYFNLKKASKKKAQLRAYQLFMSNCATIVNLAL